MNCIKDREKLRKKEWKTQKKIGNSKENENMKNYIVILEN